MGGVGVAGGSDEARATLIRDEWMRGCFVVCICLSVYVCVFICEECVSEAYC